MSHVKFVLAILAALLIGATGTLAHGFLKRASPAVGSTVKAAPAEVKLWFTEALEPAFSTVKVTDAGGNPVDKSDTAVDKSDHKLLKVSLPPLPPGTYKVIWRITSVDTHVTNGSFTFKVAP